MIDDHAVIASQPGLPGQVIVRYGPDTDQDRVARQGLGPRQPDPRDMTVQPLEPLDRDAEMEADPLFLMHLLEEARQDGSGDARQQPVLALQHIDLGSQFSRRGRDLEPDIAAADHGQPEAGPDPGLDGLGVLYGPQLEKAVQVTAGQDQPARPRARGDDQLVIGQHLTGRQGHGP